MSLRKLTVAGVTLAALFVFATIYDRVLHVDDPVEPPSQSESNAPGAGDVSEEDGEPDVSDRPGVLESKAPELLPLFPDPNDWRRKAPNIFIPKGRDCFFIYKGSHFVSEDQKTVGLNACTFVLLATQKSGRTLEDRVKNAIVFESTDRVELTLSEPIDKYAQGKGGAKFDLSKFQEGHIWGQTIVRTKLGDADMILRTREVVFNAKQIRSNFEVAFNIGPNSGTGVGFTIDLETPFRFVSGDVGKGGAEEESGAVQEDVVDKLVGSGNLGAGFSLKGVQIDKLTGCVKFYSDSLASMQTKKDASGKLSDKPSYYVEVRCKQDLYFSSNDNIVGGWCVRFNKDVELDAVHDDVTDKIIADSVYLYLQDPELKALAESNADVGEAVRRKRVTGSLAKLQPAVVRALRVNSDKPVVVRANSQNVELRSDEIVYDLLGHTIELSANDSNSPVQILQNSNGNSIEFESQLIKIQMNQDNEIEAVLSDRNGSIKADVVNSDGQSQSFEASWTGGLRAVPTNNPAGYLQLSSVGGIAVRSEMGDFLANEADFWFKLGQTQDAGTTTTPSESAAAQPAPTAPAYADASAPPSFSPASLSELKPIAADFRGDVSFQSPKGEAKVKDSVRVRFESTFDSETAGAQADASSKPGAAQLLNGATDKESASRFELGGSTLEVRCLLHYKPNAKSPTPEVVRMVLNNDVLFRERDARSGQEKMSLDANAVQLDYPGSDAMKIRLVGSSEKPAVFRTEKLALTGNDVTVDSAQNFFQALGAGALKIAIQPQKSANAPAANEPQIAKYLADGPLEIRWTSAMEFDGRKLTFKSLDSQYVVVNQGEQKLLSPEVSLVLKTPLSIFKLDVNGKDAKESLDVDSIECAGEPKRLVNIDVQAPSSNAADPRKARYIGRLMNLKYYPATGRFVASGGGEFLGTIPTTSGAMTSIADVANAQDKEKTDAKPEKGEPNWTKIHAKFLGELVGETEKQEASIKDGVRIAFAAVADPNALLNVDKPDDCPADYASIESRQAYVKFFKGAQSSSDGKSAQELELEASQNVLFKQKDYIGVCETLRYVSQKQSIVLSGSTTNKAAIYRQAYPGAPRERLGEFGRATYQLDTQKFSVDAFSHSE